MANHGDTTDLFLQAFSRGTPQEMPRSAKASGWRVKAGNKLSFAELMALDNLQKEGVRWDDTRLDGYRDLGAIILTDEAKKLDKKLQNETGFNATERNAVLNIAQTEAEILASLLTNPAMSAVLEGELQRFEQRFGEEGFAMVREISPEAGAQLHKIQREAEIQAKAAEVQAKQSVAEELKEAQRQIEEQQASRTVSEMSADDLKAELLRRDAINRSAAGDE